MGEKLNNGHCALLNQGEENEMDIFGYRTSTCRKVLCIFGYIFTLGFLMLIFYWKPEWHVWVNCIPCPLREADVVLLRTTDAFKEHTWKKVLSIQLSEFQYKSLYASPQDEYSVIKKSIRYIQVQKIRYIWDDHEKLFAKAGVLEDYYTCASIHENFGDGFGKEEQDVRRLICGQNIIDVGITPIWKLLFKEVLSPFYVFQLFSVCLWFAEEYIEYSVAIIIMSLICIGLSVYTLRQQSFKLHKLVESHNNIKVSVYGKQKGVYVEESCHLAPGDVIVIERNGLLPCDALLINGGCIVNESMLTGESIPVTKTPLPKTDNTEPWKVHSVHDYKRHVLFCGTQVIQTKAASHVKAVVLRTGFNTAKGDLVRSILYPKPVNYKLYRDALVFLCSLIGLSLIGMIYAICVFSLDGADAGEVVKKALDVITIAVPPALPAALTAGIIYAQKRLENSGIFCISPQRINLCGTINLFCFDKTGTLTEDGLDLWGVVPSNGYRFQDIISITDNTSLSWGPLLGVMTSCHSLIFLDGIVQGDPLDLKMFEYTCWEIDTSGNQNQEAMETMIVKPGPEAKKVDIEGIVVLQQFPFSSGLQRMSVVTQILNGDEYAVYMKGAPEMVASFCKPDTVPINFTEELELYTKQGFRVLGLAYKLLEKNESQRIKDLKRDEVESDLSFLGLLVMENRLKLETRPVLRELFNSSVRTVMITGDNLQTAVTVARNSGMISEGSNVILVDAMEPNETNLASITWTLLPGLKTKRFDDVDIFVDIQDKNKPDSEVKPYYFAMTGSSFQVILQHFSNLLQKILINGTIFARMSPGHKSSLVEEFQKLGYYVGMCGDGANDCGALKMAHVGISLSEQEASVASPFTSKTPNIECVPQLLKEGRAALITSFCVFKYMALYSMIQYVGVLLLYWQINSFSNYQFLFQDLAITTIISVTMSLNRAYPKLAPYRPPAQLISPPLLLSVVLNIIFSLALQICGFLIVQDQLWYSSIDILRACHPANNSFILSSGNDTSVSQNLPHKTKYQSYENTTVWLLSTINFLIVAFVFSKGKPFRQPIYTNYLFVIVLLIQLGVCIFLLFANITDLYNRMELVCTPLIWRGSIIIMLLIILFLSSVTEVAVIENRALWDILKRLTRYKSKSPYKKIRRALAKDSDWPPTNRKDHAIPTDLALTSEMGDYINPTFEINEKL
ncbi:PREDICTED: probable cation-transporting ATPase 13A4 [Nanorana parkeri]|uniref:probable cation-transporting ATPase 13A4 n=1 Tax=Nanorana parkeri TaxID=125878 RepID=UPI00085437C8|nr:PREDICTED: probable cation-transporting ATPase 13A4 [Nanorana parkeri]